MGRQDLTAVMSSSSLDRFLVAFANCGSGDYDLNQRSFTWFRQHRTFSHMLPEHPRQLDRPQDKLFLFAYWRSRLRKAWSARSKALRSNQLIFLVSDYGAFTLHVEDSAESPIEDAKRYFKTVYRLAQRGDGRTGLRPDGFLQALRRALEIASRMRQCAKPECSHRFFIAKRRSDKYCCKGCALWGKRRSKLKSWGRNWKRWPSTRWRARGGRKKFLQGGKRQ